MVNECYYLIVLNTSKSMHRGPRNVNMNMTLFSTLFLVDSEAYHPIHDFFRGYVGAWVRGCVLENLTGQQNISIINHLRNTAVQILVSAEDT